MPDPDLELCRQILAGDISSRAPATLAEVARMIRAAIAAHDEQLQRSVDRATKSLGDRFADIEDAS